MGTSKGYIAPTSKEWQLAKRAVTRYVKMGDSDSRVAAAGKYAAALRQNVAGGVTFFNAAANSIGFVQSVSSDGLDSALHAIGREDLIGKSSEEIWYELIWEFTNEGASTEDSLAADALSKSVDNLNLEDIDEISKISPVELLANLLKEYIKIAFDFSFQERISKGHTPSQVNEILQDMHMYIDNTLDANLDFSSIQEVDFSNMAASQVVKDALNDALGIFERYYEEE